MTSSYAGGLLTVSGASISEQATITVGGMTGKVIEVRASEADFEIPPLINSDVLSTYPELEEVSLVEAAAILNDGGDHPDFAADGKYASFYSSSNAECWIGIDVGANKKVLINRIRYFPYNQWVLAASYIKGAVIEASNDDTNYDSITTVDQTVHAGWNSYMPDSLSTAYRYIRIRHDSTSECKIAEFEVHGVIVNDATVSSISSYTWATTTFNDGYNTFDFTDVIEYRQDKTPIIDTVSPANGDVFGGYEITLTG